MFHARETEGSQLNIDAFRVVPIAMPQKTPRIPWRLSHSFWSHFYSTSCWICVMTCPTLSIRSLTWFGGDGRGVEVRRAHPRARLTEPNVTYVSVSIPLTCPLQQVDGTGVHDLVISTYWGDESALTCIFSAFVLALHGINVDRALWSKGLGRLGQSPARHPSPTTFGDLPQWTDNGCALQRRRNGEAGWPP